MKALRLLSLFAMVAFTSCDSMFPFDNNISKKSLYGEWKPVQYEVDGAISTPTVEQRGDYLHFRDDMTFECVEKSETVEGTWNYVPIFNVANVMSYEDPDNCIPLTIEVATEAELIYTMPTDNGGSMKVWLVK